MNIQNLKGDGTGVVHIASSQVFNVSAITSPTGATLPPTGFPVFPVSVRVTSGTASLPVSIAISDPVVIEVSGTLCGVSNVSVMAGGVLALGSTGVSCGSPVGTFQFNEVSVYASGTLSNDTTTTTTVKGQICAFRGAVIQNIQADTLWDETTATSFGPCLAYVPPTSTLTSTTSTTGSTSTTGTTTGPSGPSAPDVPQGISTNSSRRYAIFVLDSIDAD